MNVAVQLAELARRHGWQDRAAFWEGDRHWTHGAVHDLSARAAAGLAARGVGRADRVLLAVSDGVELIAAFLGTARLGAVAVIVNSALPADDHGRIVADCVPHTVVADGQIVDRFPVSVRTTTAELLAAGTDAPAAEPVAAGAETPLYVQYTSGTTGHPKGAVHTHGHLAVYHRCVGQAVLDIRPRDVILSVSQLYFAYGFGNALVFPLFAGASAVLSANRPSPGEVAAAVRQHQVTVLFAVPSFYAKLVDGAAGESFATLRIAVSAGERLPPALGERTERFLGVPVLEQIGSTEAGHAFCANSVRHNVPGTLGRPVPEFELSLRDAAGRPVADGEVGELWVRGPSVMTGYLSAAGGTGDVLVDGWLSTRDLARRDAGGTYTHHGRTDDMEIVGGINVAPTEVESVLGQHPAVREVAVVSVPGSDGATALRAVVVPNAAVADVEPLRDDLVTLARAHLAPFKVPKSVRLVRELPRTHSGKLRRFLLRAEQRTRDVT